MCKINKEIKNKTETKFHTKTFYLMEKIVYFVFYNRCTYEVKFNTISGDKKKTRKIRVYLHKLKFIFEITGDIVQCIIKAMRNLVVENSTV